MVAALRAAADVGLLVVADGRLRFRHALTRDAVLATLLPPERAALAARAARVLDGARRPRARRPALPRVRRPGPRRPRSSSSWPARTWAGARVRSAAAFLDEAGEHAAPAERVHVSDPARPRASEALEAGEPVARPPARRRERAELCLRLARAAIVAGRWADARRLVETPAGPTTPARWCSSPTPRYGAGDVAQAERLARSRRRRPARDPALLCEALAVLGRSTFSADPAASDAVLRRVAQVAAEHGLLPWRVQALFGLGSHEHTRRRPRRAVPARRARAGAGGGPARRRRAGGPAAGQRRTARRRPRAPPSRSLRGAAEQAGRLRLTGLQAMAELFAAIDAGLAGDEAAMTALARRGPRPPGRPDRGHHARPDGPRAAPPPAPRPGDGVRAARRGRAARSSRTARPSRSTTSGCGRCCGRRSATATPPPASTSAATRCSRRRATGPRWVRRRDRRGPGRARGPRPPAHFAAADADARAPAVVEPAAAAVRAGRRGRRRLGRPGARPARRPRRARGRGRRAPGPHLPRPAAHGGRADPPPSGPGGTRPCAPGASRPGRPRCSRSSPPG